MRLFMLFAIAGALCHGCSCSVSPIPTPLCEVAWRYHAVFTGVVTDITDPELPWIPPGREVPIAEALQSARRQAHAYPPGRFPNKQVRLKVTGAFIGLSPSVKEATIETGLGGGDCGYRFERGVEYIVYALQNSGGVLSTGICTPTKPLERAAQDVQYFLRLHRADPSAEIRVTAYDAGRSFGNARDGAGGVAGLAGVQVTVEGQSTRKSAVTDHSGRSVFGGLPAGEYSVSAVLDGYRMSGRPAPVKVHAKGCAEVPAVLRLDRIVTGRILTPDFLPAPGVRVEAVPARPRHEHDSPYAADSATTGADGRYELQGLTAGDYYLGISLSQSPTPEVPYTRWFYAGTEHPAAATLVRVFDRPENQSFDLTLPARLNPRMIEGIVTWPDGKPAVGAQISLVDPRWAWYPVTVVASTDDKGHFTASAFDRTTYLINAFVPGSNPASAEPAPVEPGADTAKVTLILTRKGWIPTTQIEKGLESWRNGLGLR